MRRFTTLAAAGLLALFWWQATSVSDDFSCAADEIAHLTAGYSYWAQDDYRLQPENGNFPQRWAALPLWLGDNKFPATDQMAWRISDVWDLGWQWFYRPGNDLAAMLWRGRAMIALLGVAAGALVFWWARRLHGDVGGLVAVTLFAFCPNVLAHSALITSDLAATLAFLAAVTAGWALLHRVSATRVLVFGMTLGFLALAKFSAPLIVPMFLLMAAVRLARAEPLALAWPLRGHAISRPRQAGIFFGAAVTSALVAIVLIWAAYGFRFPIMKHAEPGQARMLVGWDVLEERGGATVAAVKFSRAHQLLPEAYLYGFAHTWRFSRYRKAFLNGEYRSTGWWHFFLYTTAVKTPLPLFGLLALGLLAFRHRAKNRVRHLLDDKPLPTPEGGPPERTDLRAVRCSAGQNPAGVDGPPRDRALPFDVSNPYAWTPLLALFGVYWAFALTSSLNIGHRHMLPVYPVLFIFAAGAVSWVESATRFLGAATLALLVWFGGESLVARPNYLAYFNELVGPANAWRHLVDSSLDWGQDLPAVSRWLRAHAAGRPVFISYFGSGEPAFYGIAATRVADANFDLRPRRSPVALRGGVWAISATMFQQVYSQARGAWDAEKEKHYQALLAKLATAADRGQRFTREEGSEFEEHQFARLCHWLKATARPPAAQPGWSVLIFELSDAEVERALFGPLP